MGGKAASGGGPTPGTPGGGGGGGKGGGGGLGGMAPGAGYGDFAGGRQAALMRARQATIAQGAQDLKSAFAGTQATGTGPVALPRIRPTPPANRSVSPADFSSTNQPLPTAPSPYTNVTAAMYPPVPTYPASPAGPPTKQKLKVIS